MFPNELSADDRNLFSYLLSKGDTYKLFTTNNSYPSKIDFLSL